MAANNLIGGHGNIVGVEPMEEEDALALLNTRLPAAESGQADAKALVHELGYIPLAITHPAAYIGQGALIAHVNESMSHIAEDEEDLLHQSNAAFEAEWYSYLQGQYKAAE